MLEGPKHRMCKVRLRDLDLHILEKRKTTFLSTTTYWGEDGARFLLKTDAEMLRGYNTKHETFLLNSRKKCSPMSQKSLGMFCNWDRNGNQGQIYKVFTRSWHYSSVCVSQRYYSSLKLKFSQNRSSGVLSHNQSAAPSTSPESAQASVYSSRQRQHNQFLTSRQNN